MFEPLHFVWLAISAILITVGVILAVKKNLSLNGALTIFCVICVLSEVVKIFYVLIRKERFLFKDNGEFLGAYIKETDLPFHLCSMQIIFSFIARFAKSEKVKNFCITFMIPTGLIGALAALFIITVPTVFTNVRTYQYVLYHAGLVWISIVLIFKKKERLDLKAFFKVIVGLFVAAIFAIYINGLTQNTNFLYVSAPPMEGLPVLNMNNGYLCYFLSYMGVAVLLLLIFFLPFIIYYKVKDKKQ